MSAAKLSALAPTGEEFDIVDPAVARLVLRVGPTGTKRWLFRFRWRGERPRIALGDFPETGLAEARELALAHRREIKRGIDPRKSERPYLGPAHVLPLSSSELPQRTSTSTLRSISVAADAKGTREIPKPELGDKSSFHFLAYEYVEYFVKPSRDVPEEVIRILVKDALPHWKGRDARTITSREIIERLDAIVARGAPVMANRTAAILDQMFRFGVHRSIVASSPVRTRRSGSKSGSGQWSQWDDIGWVHYPEIGWSHSDEIRWVQSLEILQQPLRRSNNTCPGRSSVQDRADS
jgi:hypothetical protein